MFRLLNRYLGSHKRDLNPEAWRVLTRVAFAFFLDSLDVQPPLIGDDEYSYDLVQPELDASGALAVILPTDVDERAAGVTSVS